MKKIILPLFLSLAFTAPLSTVFARDANTEIEDLERQLKILKLEKEIAQLRGTTTQQPLPSTSTPSYDQGVPLGSGSIPGGSQSNSDPRKNYGSSYGYPTQSPVTFTNPGIYSVNQTSSTSSDSSRKKQQEQDDYILALRLAKEGHQNTDSNFNRNTSPSITNSHNNLSFSTPGDNKEKIDIWAQYQRGNRSVDFSVRGNVSDLIDIFDHESSDEVVQLTIFQIAPLATDKIYRSNFGDTSQIYDYFNCQPYTLDRTTRQFVDAFCGQFGGNKSGINIQSIVSDSRINAALRIVGRTDLMRGNPELAVHAYVMNDESNRLFTKQNMIDLGYDDSSIDSVLTKKWKSRQPSKYWSYINNPNQGCN